MTILELIQKTTSYFEKAGVPNSRLDIELLLSHVLGLKRMELYLQFERVLTENELDQLRPLVKRRGLREPLQHIIGSVDFCDVKLQVSPAALIPRPETELLVQAVLDRFSADSSFKFLDMGTGTGAVALAICKVRPHASAIAIDISTEALELAKTHPEKNQILNQIEFRQGNLFEPVKPGEEFDLIVSNPPYIPTNVISTLQSEVQHDPKLALDGGEDGLKIISALIRDSQKYLKPRGRLIFEMGHDQRSSVEKLLQNENFGEIGFVNDLQGYARVALTRKL